MDIDKASLQSIAETSSQIVNTAQDVNQFSHVRKQITTESLLLLSELMDNSTNINTSFGMVNDNLQLFISRSTGNLKGLVENVKHLKGIISNIDNIKSKLHDIAGEVEDLMQIVDTIKQDTDEINILATNATIVSGKYHTISSVFEVLSGKLNNMTEFINQNLEHILNLVEPINKGIENMIEINSLMLSDLEKGHVLFIDFSDELEKQKEVISEQVRKAGISGEKILDQKNKLSEINNHVLQMDQDAIKAIDGSANVMNTGKELLEAVEHISSHEDTISENDFIEKIDFINQKASIIWNTAKNVNEKSKSQLEFSFSALNFCKVIIEESKILEATVKTFTSQSVENNELTIKISNGIKGLTEQLNEIEKKINASNDTLNRFTNDYLKINDIMIILEKILKFMKIIGIYSKIEASRDPVEFDGFLTISKEIQSLQNHIKSTLPHIENNIKNTKSLITIVNDSYKTFSEEFREIRQSSYAIAKDLEVISSMSVRAEKVSKEILEESLTLDNLLNDLELYLVKLTDVVKKPIEGSAGNIQRGKDIEEKTNYIKSELSKNTLASLSAS